MKPVYRSDTITILIGSVIFAWLAVSWITHAVVCIKTASWLFLIAGAIFFPVGVIHGTGVWFNWF